MSATQEYLTFCCQEQWRKGLFCLTQWVDDSVTLSQGRHIGLYCPAPVDAGEAGFGWDRLKLGAELPPDTSLRIYARAGEEAVWEGWQELARGAPEGELVPLALRLFGPPVAEGTDCCLSCTGRYLWLALELTAAGGESPRLDSVSLRMSGDHMVDYLPAIYQGEDFTYRFLSIFNSMFQDMEAEIDALPRLLDLDSAPRPMLDYLAGWLCVDRAEEGEDLRTLLKHILEDYEALYTVRGIRASVRRLTGREPRIIEHFTVDPNDPECRNPALYRRLYGEDPYRFFLLLEEDTFASRDSMERFLDRMEDLIPAGTELELVLLKNCVQLDWHTYLGINSRVGDYRQAAINERVTIHYDMTIGGANNE